MGEITFTRLNKFTKEELHTIEDAILAAVYPLRNALKYTQAIRSALTDSLTGAGNRIALDNALQREIDISLRYDHALSIAMIDVDYFKSINDQYGHATGDVVLKQISQTLIKNCRNADRVFRYGGEEFVVLFNKTELDGALVITERLRQLIEKSSCQHKGQEIPVSISAGVASLTSCKAEKDVLKNLLERADQALYRAKDCGRNQVISETTPVSSAEPNC